MERAAMTAKEINLIFEKEDTIVIDAHTTLAQVAESEILRRHVKPCLLYTSRCV